MIDMGIVDRMNGILENVMQSNQEWCTDHLLEIINEILHMASEVKKKQGGESKGGDLDALPQLIFDSFLVNFEYFMVLLTASDLVSKIMQVFFV